MIRHVVTLRFVEDVTPAQRDAVADGVRALARKIKEVRAVSCGRDVGLDENNSDFVAVVDVEDEAAYLAYATDPAHVALVNDVIRPILAERRAVQYHTEP